MQTESGLRLHEVEFSRNAEGLESGQIRRQQIVNRVIAKTGDETPRANEMALSGYIVGPNTMAGEHDVKFAFRQHHPPREVHHKIVKMAFEVGTVDKTAASVGFNMDLSGVAFPGLGAYSLQISIGDTIIGERPLYVTTAPKPGELVTFTLSRAPGDPGIAVAAGLSLHLIPPSTDQTVTFLINAAVSEYIDNIEMSDGVIVRNASVTEAGPDTPRVTLSLENPSQPAVGQDGGLYNFRLLKIEKAETDGRGYYVYHLTVTTH